MRVLDRYLLREWLKVFGVTLLGFPILVIVIDLTDKLDRYVSRGLSAKAIALSYVFGMPETMFQVLPAAVLFATVFTVGNLGRHSELTAAKASGISLRRLLAPLFSAAGASIVLGLVIGELLPGATVRRSELLGERVIRSTTSRYNFVYRADSGWVYAIRSLEVTPRSMRDVILEREGAGADYPTIVVAAQSAQYGQGRRPRWTLAHGTVRYLLGADRELAFGFDSMRTTALRETPTDLLAEPKAPDEMRYAELGRYIDALARSGSDTRKLRVERALKIAIPFTCIIIALFGAPLALTNPRSGLTFGIGASLATTFIFLLLVQLSKAVGAGGVLPPVVAAWSPNLLFGAIGVYLMKRAPS